MQNNKQVTKVRQSITKRQRNLLRASDTIKCTSALESDNLYFIPKLTIIAGLPHQKHKSNKFTQISGKYTLTVTSATGLGIPYGCAARSLIAWFTTEAMRKGSPTLTLPRKITELMRTIGCKSCKKPDRTRFRVQIEQLLTTVFSSETRAGAASTVKIIPVCQEYALWPENGDESVVCLSDEFFTQITKNAIPIDKRAFMTLRQSPLATDLYCLLTHKASYINSKVAISTNQLMRQFGGNYSDNRAGRRNFGERLRKAIVDVSIIYPESRATCLAGRIMLAPAKTHILPKPVDKTVNL